MILVLGLGPHVGHGDYSKNSKINLKKIFLKKEDRVEFVASVSTAGGQEGEFHGSQAPESQPQWRYLNSKFRGRGKKLYFKNLPSNSYDWQI